jgi:hypothetical protein
VVEAIGGTFHHKRAAASAGPQNYRTTGSGGVGGTLRHTEIQNYYRAEKNFAFSGFVYILTIYFVMAYGRFFVKKWVRICGENAVKVHPI